MSLRQGGCALNRKGFTLIELLVAASLFLAAVLAFGLLLNSGKSSIASALRRNQAAYILQAKMEELKALPFDQLPALNGCAFAQGQAKVSVLAVLADLLKIEVEHKWDTNKFPLKLCSLRSKY